MDKIPAELIQKWEKDHTLLLEKEHEDALLRLIKHDITGKYQLNRYFLLRTSWQESKWQVSIDFQDKDAEEVIRYFW